MPFKEEGTDAVDDLKYFGLIIVVLILAWYFLSRHIEEKYYGEEVDWPSAEELKKTYSRDPKEFREQFLCKFEPESKITPNNPPRKP